MSGINATMSSTLSALLAQQAAINTVSTNIANVNTDGYTRQSSVFTITTSGTEETAKRVYDAFLQKQINSSNQALGYWETRSEYLNSVETIFDESEGSGLSEAMSDFWTAWQDLVNDSSGSTERSVLVSAADTMADTLNTMYSDLTTVQSNIDDDVVDTVASINDTLQKIADLNQQLAQTKASGGDTSTILDSLDSLVTDLSSSLNVKAYTNDTGQVCIQLSDGKALVDGTKAWSLSTATNATTGLQDVTWVDEGGNAYVVNDAITGGKLGAELEIRDEVIPSYQDQLDDLAVAIMTEVNTLHTTGYDLNGTGGLAFFTGTGAADMAVNSTILNDTDRVAASSSATNPTGNATIATAISELADSLALNSGTSTFSDYYSTLVTKVGSAVETASEKASTQSDTVDTYKNLRDSISGVSTDEELTKLTMYQSAYSAAAKVMNVLDEMMQTMIEM